GQLAVQSGEKCGERVWHFPHGEDFIEDLKSEVADIQQCSRQANADHILAATFLSQFIEKGPKWLHIDLSADTNSGGLGIIGSTATGFGVRLVNEMIKNLKGDK
ncbi:MAG: hypothetical protein KDD25_08810, partial [Bdellovibrionales bacterium]|nr:hypothetical protein [Bdellovibrionales bacterium]